MNRNTTAHDLLDAPPPTATESEHALLGAILMWPEVLDHVAEIVCGGDFHDGDLGTLFSVPAILYDSRFPVEDLKALLPELRRQSVAESVLGPAFLADLAQKTQPAHGVTYAKEVRTAADLRRQREIACDWLERIHTGAAPADLAVWVDAELQTMGHRSGEPVRQVSEIAAEIIADLRRPDAARPVVMTGLICHDEAAGGWMPGEQVILAARPGVGKTALAAQVGEYNAMRDRRVLFVSLEMRDRELITRMLCGTASVDSRRFRSGRFDSRDVDRIDQVAADIGDIPLRVWAPPSATLPRIRAVAKREWAAGGLDLLVVDYIGLVLPDDKTRPRHEQVAAVSAGFKAVAKELNVPVLALCQLNREADGSEPRLSHLRESGAIEQDADIVLFIHRTTPETARLIIAKHRHGDTGSVSLKWIPHRTRFADPESHKPATHEPAHRNSCSQ